MDKLFSSILEKRPTLKENSVKMYMRNLKKLNEFSGNPDLYNLNILKNKKKVDEFLKEKKQNTQKNYLASIVVLIQSHPDIFDTEGTESLLIKYRTDMESVHNELQDEFKKQNKTENQSKNWMELKELQKVVTEYKRQLKNLKVFNKTEHTAKEKELAQMYMVGSLYVLDPENNPPLRADYAPMKIINSKEYKKLSPEELKKNYLVISGKLSKFFHLGEYKTDKKYGEKLIKVGSKLNSVINNWLKVNKTENFLINSKGGAMSSNGLTKFLTKTFSPTGKKIAVNMLRHIVITHLFPPNLEEKEKTADLMGHSTSQQTLYSKK